MSFNRNLFILVFLVLCTGCNTNPSTKSGVLLQNQTFSVSGIDRNYHIYLPEVKTDSPVVMLLHGNSGSSDQILGILPVKSPFKLWLDIAERENLILVVPDGLTGPNGKQGWNDCRNDAPTNPVADDVTFLSSLIDSVQQTYATSNSNVFSVGISNGALMTMRLADEIPQKISAVALVVASRPVNSECPNSDIPLPVLIMNGTADPILPYYGGQIKGNRGDVYSTPETVEYWINRNSTDIIPLETIIEDKDPNDESTTKRFTYLNGQNNTVIEHYEVLNGGHTEPSIAERYGPIYSMIVGNQNGDFEMAEEIWRFLASQ